MDKSVGAGMKRPWMKIQDKNVHLEPKPKILQQLLEIQPSRPHTPDWQGVDERHEGTDGACELVSIVGVADGSVCRHGGAANDRDSSAENFVDDSSSEVFANDSSNKSEDLSNYSSNQSSELFANDSSCNDTPDDFSEVIPSNDIASSNSNNLSKPLPSIVLQQRPLSCASSSSQSIGNMVANVCNKICNRSCSKFISNMEESARKNMMVYFKGSKKLETKRKLLDHLKSQEVIEKDSSSFIYLSQSFCLSSFSNATGISPYLLDKVLKDFQKGVRQYISGNADTPRRSLAHVQFVAWMVSFSELHGQADPEKLTTVLPAFLNKAELFKIYQAEAPLPRLKSSTFYFLMKTVFGVNRIDKTLPNIRISKYSSHSKVSHKNFFRLIFFIFNCFSFILKPFFMAYLV